MMQDVDTGLVSQRSNLALISLLFPGIYIVFTFWAKSHDVSLNWSQFLFPGCFVFAKPLFLCKIVVFYCRDGLNLVILAL